VTKIPSSILKQAIRAVHLFSKGAAKERANHGDMIFLKITVPPKKDGFRRCQSRQVLMSLYIHTQDAAIVNETNHFFPAFFFTAGFRFLLLLDCSIT
jgi:hypothetical protein